MPKQVYASPGKTLFASATDEKSADGSHHHYAFTNVPAPGAPEIPLSSIKFQNGRPEDVGVNGVSDVMVLAAVVDHLQGFQRGPFACNENTQAIAALENAIAWIRLRPNLSGRVQGTAKGATPE
jgi:hypothetical protein